MKNESIKGKVGKSVTFQDIFNNTKAVDDMTHEECAAFLKAYQQWVNWLPADIVYWGSKIGETIRISERSGTAKNGYYVGFECEIKMHKVEGIDRVYDVMEKKYFIEKQKSLIPASNIVDFSFISEKTEDKDE